jgi:hypothetical protein
MQATATTAPAKISHSLVRTVTLHPFVVSVDRFYPRATWPYDQSRAKKCSRARPYLR